MTKREKIDDILNTLQTLYPNPVPPLQYKDAYTLLICVLLSARCTDARVNKTTPALFALADNPYDMAKLPTETIQNIIRPCGLSPMKSKGIRTLSQILIDQYGGQVPADMSALEALPAVGHKTASVVMAQWFRVPAFPIDTHIHRSAYRWGLSNGRNVEQTERDLKKLIPRDLWIDTHLQIIYYARQYCPAVKHVWQNCPLCKKYLRKSLRKSA